MSIVSIAIWQVSLGSGVKSLGNGVQSRAGAKGNISIGVVVWVVGISSSLSLDNMALSQWVQSLGDWVKSSARSEGNIGMSIGVGGIGVGVGSISKIESISLSLPLDHMSLSHWIQSLSDWVQPSARSKWNSGVSIGIGISSICIGISHILG